MLSSSIVLFSLLFPLLSTSIIGTILALKEFQLVSKYIRHIKKKKSFDDLIIKNDKHTQGLDADN
ncbi:hypothetical protein [Candidatus Nitrosocosmicus franklandus]|uniref:hypothetical protein n=1 Tax=Candidatus Nitrosocosmicus franklandianus TaxID=1798806 RepID=UPI0010697ACE|nr:hypothetical protein [Candidatus Nitrosocosmicus franklandus]